MIRWFLLYLGAAVISFVSGALASYLGLLWAGMISN